MSAETGARPAAVEVINLADKLSRFADTWSPRIVGELNGQQVKLAKLEGEFVWHHHEDEDELFLVIEGELRMELEDRSLELRPGEMCIVPRGVEHRPVCRVPTSVLLFEPAGTLNTGNVRGLRTVEEPSRI